MEIKEYRGKKPVISGSAFISSTSVLIGDLVIKDESSVWFNAVIRADGGHIEIGRRSNVQDNSTLHTDPGHDLTIGDNVTIGHNAVIHCKSIGDNTLVGMNATLLSGAVIGRNCIIAAGALVTENTVIEDNSLVMGLPGKAVRKLEAKEEEKILKNAVEYCEKAKNYKEI
ncbi:MAG: gamma carbonic anhydrase family protein [Lachnospiraceae bacterium]|nr:gamma carbonic anhydrase family protein [Lachnospiraceae bacterium]